LKIIPRSSNADCSEVFKATLSARWSLRHATDIDMADWKVITNADGSKQSCYRASRYLVLDKMPGGKAGDAAA
jgi:hypothetical protein